MAILLIMNGVFHLKQNTYNLRNFHAFDTDVPRNNCMLNSVVYRANQLWETLPFDLENSRARIILKRIKKTSVALDVHVKFTKGLLLMLDTFNSLHQYSFSLNFISIFFVCLISVPKIKA